MTTVDGTAQLVTITINGANDAAVISGTTTGAVTEAGGVNNATPGTPIATGDLTSTDVDNPPDAWDAVSASLRSASGYGTYTLTAGGAWTFTLDNTNAAVQALNAGGTLTDTPHRLHGRRHRAARHRHHPWRQRRRRDQRDHGRAP